MGVNFHGCILTNSRGNDYPMVVLEQLSKKDMMIPCKKTISVQQTTELLIKKEWLHFGLPSSIISNRNSRFLSYIWQAF